jgi:hypothetical protein
MGPHAIRAFTDVFNSSTRLNSIPNLWKISKIIPIPKPGKPPTDPASYRPISLLSNPSKILERLVLNRITPDIPLSPTQHGFRPLHSTTSLLANLTQTTLEGLNGKAPANRTVLAAVDISKAFDTVPRHKLIEKILDTTIHPNLQKWLANFLSGRQAFTTYGGKSSTMRLFPNGVPQGSVLSPFLFNLFMHDLPTPTDTNTNVASYADDLMIYSQHSDHRTAALHLQDHLDATERWLETNRMGVSAAKSSVTLITPWNKELADEPQVTLHGAPIGVQSNTTILGLTLDSGMTLRPHVEAVNTKTKELLYWCTGLG